MDTVTVSYRGLIRQFNLPHTLGELAAQCEAAFCTGAAWEPGSVKLIGRGGAAIKPLEQPDRITKEAGVPWCGI